MNDQTRDIPEGPEPKYDRVVSGYETFRSDHAFACQWGGSLPGFELAYETWGELSPARDNVVLLDGTGKTETHRIKVTWNHRINKRLRWNNNLTWKNRDNPYVAENGWLRAFGGYRDEANGIVNGRAASPT